MNSAPAVSRDAYYDNLRLFLMFVVVFCHGIETMRNAPQIIQLHETLLTFVMPTFVFLTGFFAKGMAEPASPKRLKILNLILVYLLAQAFKCLVTGTFNFLAPTYGNWYLIAIIIWYGILPMVARFKTSIVFVFSVVAALLICLDKNAPTVFFLSRVFCFFPFFYLGFSLSREQMAKLRTPKVRLIGAAVLLLSVAVCLLIWNDAVPLGILHANSTYAKMKLTLKAGILFRLLWYVMATATGFGVLSIIPSRHTPLTVLGTRTLPIFIIHTCVYHVLAKKTNFFPTLASIDGGYIYIYICASDWSFSCRSLPRWSAATSGSAKPLTG